MFRLYGLVITICVGLVFTGLAAPANAQEPTPKIKLKASRGSITFGDKVELGGRIKPPLPGQQVNIVSDERIVARATTDGKGRYSVKVKPRRNQTFRAQWATAVSKKQRVRVKPRVNAHLGKVRLLRKARVHGRVAPAVEGARPMVRLIEGNRTVGKKRVKLHKDGRFSTRVRIRSVDPVHAQAMFHPKGLAGAKDRTAAKAPPTPSLSEGSEGAYVKLVERRLSSLGYPLGRVDDSYDYKTRDAVIAFHKVQGLPRVGDVADYTWRALARPKRPQPVSKDGYHFEIDQTKQVLYIVRKGEIRTIVHVSTGANGYTRDGVWTVHRQLDGYSPGRLYHPSYFDGARAVHGWPDVPTYPASHGCARTPMWIAPWLNDKAYVGMTVRVYHS